MRISKSISVIAQKIINLSNYKNDTVFVVLIGGCSRTGKSTLANMLIEILNTSGYFSLLLRIDSWLISIDERKHGSTVFERYNTNAIIDSVEKIVKGGTIMPPIYDPIKRKKTDEYSSSPVSIQSGILIVEGTITLSIKELLDKSGFRIFVETSDLIRIKRLIDFYSRVKKVPKQEYKQILSSREKEEIPFIKNTASKADIIFRW